MGGIKLTAFRHPKTIWQPRKGPGQKQGKAAPVRVTNMPNCVVTACFGQRSRIREAVPVPGVRFVCHTDDAGKIVKPWTAVVNADPGVPPRLKARVSKLSLLSNLQGGEEVAVWIDASMSVRSLAGLVEASKGAPLAAFAHPERTCAYEEAAVAASRGLGADGVDAQMLRYSARGLPAKNGLMATGVLVMRRSFAEACAEWLKEVQIGSLRDQVSLAYILWRFKVKCAVLPGNVYDNQWVRWHGHERRT